MKNTKKIHGTGRFLSLLLALCMILTFIPTVAFAQDSPVQIEVKNSQNGNTQYKVNGGDWIGLNGSKVWDINGVSDGDTVTVRAIPNQDQELDTTGTQFYVDGTKGTINCDNLKTEAGWSFKYTNGSNYQVCVEYRGENEGGNQNSNVEVQFDNATISGNVVTFNVDNKAVTLTVDGATVSEDRKVTVDRNKLDAVTFTAGDSFNVETMQITVRGADNYNNALSVNNKVASLNGLNFPGDWLHLEIEAKGGGDNPPPGPGPGGDPAGGTDNIELEINFTGTSMHAWINNKNVDLTDGAEFKGTINGAGKNDVNETNVLRFQEDFGFKPVTEFVINGVTYKEGMEAVKFVKDQGYFITVPGASKYTVTGAAAEDATVDRTIIWANVGAKEDAPDYAEDMLLKHGSAKIIAVYAEDGRLVDKEEYLGRDSDEYGVSKDGLGWAKVVPGSKVVFEFVPEYGYQLTSVKSNGFPLEPQKTINQYTFTMPDANVHFAAEFTKTGDELKADSKKVSGGSINLGNKLEGGSAQLTVSDATLSSDKIAGFENAAGEYTISDYLDIDLYNVFYKGKDDADDVWSNKIDELDEYATITIKLEDGVNADDIVIVHNLHDGDKYEIINIDSYDPATNTITFKTKSFSAYAIATKGLVKVTKDEITNAIKDANNASKAEVLISVPKDQDVSYIEFPVASVKEVANGKKGLTIETKTATVTLDSKALETIAGKADGENITLNLVKIAKDDLNEKQQKAIKGINVDTILSAEILCGDKIISKDFGGGKATVKLPYTAAEGKKLSDYTIVYIADDGKMLRIPTKVVDGNLVFEIEHFSEYAVALSSEVANVPLSGETPKTGDATNMMPWLGLMAITGAGAVVFKRKED